MSAFRDHRGKALLLVAAALVLAAIACGPTAQPTAAPTAVPVVPTAVPPTQPPAAQASLTVVNQTGGADLLSVCLADDQRFVGGGSAGRKQRDRQRGQLHAERQRGQL